jgi:hypothetical protein
MKPSLFVLICCVIAILGLGEAKAVLVDFDGVAGGLNKSGDLFIGSGVTFSTGTIPNAISVGDTITFSSPDPHFDLFGPVNAISSPNFAVAHNGGLNDLLMSFTTPITSISVISDAAPGEAADVIRLIALQSLGSNQYMVLGFDQKLDNAIFPDANSILTVSLASPFSFAIFQTTTEQEGFDNLTFTPVPEPTSLIFLASGLLGLAAYRYCVHK